MTFLNKIRHQTKHASTNPLHLHAFFLLTAITLILILGLIMVFNTSSAEALDYDLNASTHQALIKQCLYAFIGILLSTGIWFIGYLEILKLSVPILIFLTICLLLVFLPGIGMEINGAHRWISLGHYSIQPSEFVKLAIPCFFIHTMLKQGRGHRNFFKIMLLIQVPLFLILIEPANGTTAIIIATLMVLFILMRINIKLWLLPMVLILLIGLAVASTMPHVSSRLKAFANPEMDIRGRGHQPYQAKIAVGSGGLTGKGLGHSMQKLHYLPEAQNDYIAAIFAEEFGFLGMFFLIFLYMLVCYAGFYIAFQSKHIEGFYLGSALTFLISIQAFLNLAVVSSLLPSTGLNLPFFSQGGSSLVANMIGLTLLLDIARRGR